MTVRNRSYPDQEQRHHDPPDGGGNPVFLSDFYFIDFNLKNLLSLC